MSSPSCTILLFDAYQLSVCFHFSLLFGHSGVWKRTPYFYCLLKPRQYFRFVCSSTSVNTMIAKMNPKNSSTAHEQIRLKYFFSFLLWLVCSWKDQTNLKNMLLMIRDLSLRVSNAARTFACFFFSSYSAYFVNIPCQQNYQLYGACIRKSSWFLVNAISQAVCWWPLRQEVDWIRRY